MMIRRWHVYHFPLSYEGEANSVSLPDLQGASKHVGPQVIRNATKRWYGLSFLETDAVWKHLRT